jgi:hypothetical protein
VQRAAWSARPRAPFLEQQQWQPAAQAAAAHARRVHGACTAAHASHARARARRRAAAGGAARARARAAASVATCSHSRERFSDFCVFTNRGAESSAASAGAVRSSPRKRRAIQRWADESLQMAAAGVDGYKRRRITRLAHSPRHPPSPQPTAATEMDA